MSEYLNLSPEFRTALRGMSPVDAAKAVRPFVSSEVEALESELLEKNGRFVSVRMSRKGKVRKASPLLDRVEKRSTFTVQADVSYLNKASVIEAHTSGERERKPNPNDLHLSKVLVYNMNTDKLRIGFGTVDNPSLERKVTWLVDGKEVSKESLESDLLASETKPSEASDWITLLPSTIEAISRFDNPAFETA